MNHPRRRSATGLYGAACALILAGSVCLVSALLTEDLGVGSALVAFVASGGGLFLLGVGVLRGRPMPPGA